MCMSTYIRLVWMHACVKRAQQEVNKESLSTHEKNLKGYSQDDDDTVFL